MFQDLEGLVGVEGEDHLVEALRAFVSSDVHPVLVPPDGAHRTPEPDPVPKGPDQGLEVSEAAAEAQAYEREVSREMDVTSRAALVKHGLAVNELAPEEIARIREHLKPVTEKFTQEYGVELVQAMSEEIGKVRNAH